jgi:hypothetical protein
MNCCKTCFSICEPLISCFEDLLIYVPVGYTFDQIKVRITNGINYVTYQTCDVLAGTHVEINIVTSEIPEGFFSAYGGPYEIRFIDPNLQELIFVAIDGKTYNCITFNVANGSTDETVAFVNAFYNDLPQGY